MTEHDTGTQPIDRDGPVEERTTVLGGETRETVVARERDRHGGVKLGSAFFGWLTATGMSVLLTALVAAAGVAVGVVTDSRVDDVATAATSTGAVDTVTWVSGIVLLVILLLSYYCGGYVAGRMARFNGLKQGLAVWAWAILIAVVVALIAITAGSEYDVLSTLNSFPRIPVGDGTLSTPGLAALIAVVVATLVGALLGGLAGMRFHRTVDRTGLGH